VSCLGICVEMCDGFDGLRI